MRLQEAEEKKVGDFRYFGLTVQSKCYLCQEKTVLSGLKDEVDINKTKCDNTIVMGGFYCSKNFEF